MPLLITEEEWRGIARGVAQRAELLERVLADVYGEGRLIAEGALPAAALTGSADYVGGDARREADQEVDGFVSTRLTSAADLMARGGRLATGRKRHLDADTPWKTGWSSPRLFPIFTLSSTLRASRLFFGR